MPKLEMMSLEAELYDSALDLASGKEISLERTRLIRENPITFGWLMAFILQRAEIGILFF